MIATALVTDLRLDLVPVDDRLLPVRLVAARQIVLGRNRNECDLVSWFLPRGTDNDRETLKLSQVHAYLALEESRLRVRDADSATGTFWNGAPVQAGDGIISPAGLDGKLSLGRNFHLAVEWLPVGQPSCVMLRPLVSDPAFRKCIWMPVVSCGFDINPGEPLIWLHPAALEKPADVVIEVRRRDLWWCPADGAEVRIEKGMELTMGDLVLKADLT